MNRHAYLLMAHNNFPLLLELIRLLDHERNVIYLHIDKKVPEEQFLQLQRDSKQLRDKHALCSPLIFTDRISVHWGGYSQIACELLLLKAAAGEDHFAYYHLLSGSDLPIKPMDTILAFFDNLPPNAGREFLAFDSREVPSHVRERISLYHIFRESAHPLAEPLDALFTRVQRLLHVNRLKNSSLTLQKGANWFSITDALVRYTLEREAFIHRTFSRSVCADELFLQTIVANSPFAEQIYAPYGDENSMANLRYIDWKRGENNSPYVFRREDVKMLQKLPHLFARKFEENIF
ncbi:MAG: beta-1,6-N-acetylglucosaminyltransferase [Lachnospiraceae bacterium]|nr:beta-1,6-N-acetylglucosaminyltransferase [Lachnospiraceae bacterium]